MEQYIQLREQLHSLQVNGSEGVSMMYSTINIVVHGYTCIDCVLCVLIYIRIGRFDYEKNEIVVFKKKNKSSKLTSFCGRGVVNAPYTAVAEFIKDIESSFVWDKFLVVS